MHFVIKFDFSKTPGALSIISVNIQHKRNFSFTPVKLAKSKAAEHNKKFLCLLAMSQTFQSTQTAE